MKNIILLFCIAVLCLNQTTAQSCFPDHLILRTQAEVDAFPQNYPDCTMVPGSITIQADGADITNLYGLNQITSITGSLEVKHNNGLHDLSGLNNLNFVIGHIYIGENESLANLVGLSSLHTIGSYLVLWNNNSLSNLTGLDNLNAIADNLYIYDNPSLDNLDGLGNLTVTGSNVSIMNNVSLNNLTSLNKLAAIGGHLFLYRNVKLADLRGLEHLTVIGGDLTIQDLPELTSLEALSDLVGINGILTVKENESLTNLNGLDNIWYQTITKVVLTGSQSLSYCGVESICAFMENGGEVVLSGNAFGCNDTDEVTVSCSTSGLDKQDTQNLSLFPNPTFGTVNLSRPLATNATFHLMNMAGQNVRQGNIYHNSIDMSAEKNGVYLLEIKDDNATFVKRIVKM